METRRRIKNWWLDGFNKKKPMKRYLLIVATYENYAREFAERGIDIDVYEYKFSELNEMLKEYDRNNR